MDKNKIAKELVKVAKELMAFGFEVDAEELASKIHTMDIFEIARIIKRDWRPVNFAAKPYLSAMMGLESVNDNYGYDSGKMIVNYFLSNARGWKGPVAKIVKKELNKRAR